MWQNLWKTAFTLIAILHIAQAWRFVCFKGSFDNSLSVAYQNATQQITNGFIDINKQTVIVANGYKKGDINTDGTKELIIAYLQYDKNVCGIDYPVEADFGSAPLVNYPVVTLLAYQISQQIAEMFTILEKQGFDVNKLHLVGHSLGAHVLGNAGTIYSQKTGKQVRWITALDPAKPGYEGILHEPRVGTESAVFVNAIHTDPARYGMADAVAHLDIFVNLIEYDRDGHQPMCPPVNIVVNPPLSPKDACSHRFSVNLDIEALLYFIANNNCQLLAAKAESVAEWSSPTFVPDQVTCFGENINQTYRGRFYMRTNTQPPYGLGAAGTKAQ